MAATDTDSVHDHMTRLRMKMVQQKIENEKDRIVNRPPTVESTDNDLEQQARLQQAMLRRQELLDKIRREQLLNDEAKRPRTYSARRRYTPSPLPIPPSRRSLPDYAKVNFYNQYPEAYRSRPGPEMSQVKHVIEHKIATPKPQPYYLPPIEAPLQPPPPVIIQAPPPPRIMQQPAPQIIQAPYPQHIIQQVPNPIIQTLPGFQPEQKGMFNKAEFGEMMMMQNAQMHQMVMQKMMMGSLGHSECHDDCHGHDGHNCHDCHGHGDHSCHDCHSGCCSHHGISGAACYDCYPRVPATGSVHHHHYTAPPPSQPVVQQYSTIPVIPPMDIRGGYMPREYVSPYPGPGYNYSPYDEGNNYYTYY